MSAYIQHCIIKREKFQVFFVNIYFFVKYFSGYCIQSGFVVYCMMMFYVNDTIACFLR